MFLLGMDRLQGWLCQVTKVSWSLYEQKRDLCHACIWPYWIWPYFPGSLPVCANWTHMAVAWLPPGRQWQHVGQGPASFYCNGSESKYFRLRDVHSLQSIINSVVATKEVTDNVQPTTVSNKTLFTEAAYQEICMLTLSPGDGGQRLEGAKFWKRSVVLWWTLRLKDSLTSCSASIRNAVMKRSKLFYS